MATLDEERYLRNLLLFGEGGMFLLRHVVVHEIAKTGKTLETLLLEKKTSSFNNILREQHQFLYPSPSTANVDLSTWDMSILHLVVKRLFSQGLPPHVFSAIKALKGYRDSLQGHPSSMSMTASDYKSSRQHIMNTLRSIATYVKQTVPTEEIIKRTESEGIDIRSVIRQIKETQAFSTSIQSIIEDKLQPINRNLSSLQKDVKTVTGNVDANEKNRKEAHEEIKSSLQSLQECSEDLKESAACSKTFQEEAHDDIKVCLQSLHVSSEDSKLDLATVLGHVRRLHSSKVHETKHNFKKELITIIRAECENEEKRKQATELLYTFVQIIQGHNTYDEEEIKRIITQRIDYYGEPTLQLLDDMIEWFSDIYKHCDDTDTARLKCIQLPIFCSSVTGILTLLSYINGNQCKRHLTSISSTISNIFGVACSLVWEVEHTSLQSTMSSFLGDTGPECSTDEKKLILPLHATDIKQLTHVWNMFGGEARSDHLEKVSGTLSKIFKETIVLKASVDKNQLLEAVKQTVDEEKTIKNRSPGYAPRHSPDSDLEESTKEEFERVIKRILSNHAVVPEQREEIKRLRVEDSAEQKQDYEKAKAEWRTMMKQDYHNTVLKVPAIFKNCSTVKELLEQSNVIIMLCGQEPRLATRMSRYIYDIVAGDPLVQRYRRTVDSGVYGDYSCIRDIQHLIFDSMKECNACLIENRPIFYIGDLCIKRNNFICSSIDQQQIAPDTVHSIYVEVINKENVKFLKSLPKFKHLEKITIELDIMSSSTENVDPMINEVNNSIAETIRINVSTLKSLSLRCTGKLCKIIVPVLPSMTNLVAIQMTIIVMSHNDTTRISEFLKRNSHLEQIYIGITCECRNQHDVDLSKHQNLQYLYMDDSMCVTDIDTVNLEVCTCRNIKSTKDIKIFDSIEKCDKLKKLELCVEYNKSISFHTSITERLVTVLPLLHNLSKLELWRFRLTDNIIQVPSEMKSLKVIDLNCVIMSITTCRKFVDSLPSIPHTVDVMLYRCYITGDGKELNVDYRLLLGLGGEKINEARQYVKDQKQLFNVKQDDNWFKFSTKK